MIYFLNYYSALPIEIVSEMKSLEVYVMDTAVFECIFNTENVQVIWKYKDKALTKTERIKMRSRFSKQQLIIDECQLDDSGWYICQSGDVHTKAELVVIGRLRTAQFLRQLLALYSFYSGN